MKSLPHLPSQMNYHSNVIAKQTKLPSNGSSVLAKSRIGRPRGTGPRNSGTNSESGFSSGDALDVKDLRSPRFGS